MNPLTVLPAQARKYVYALLVLAALVYAAYQAADGDWLTALGSVLVSLTGGMAVSNTDAAFFAKSAEPAPAPAPASAPAADAAPTDPPAPAAAPDPTTGQEG